jgi:MFS family permease
MYVAELAPAAIRGRLVLCFQLAIGVGIVISTLVGASEAVSWRVAIGAAAVPALVMLLLQLRLPESPRWLVKHGRRYEAEKVLRDVRPAGYDISSELEEIVALEERKQQASRHNRGWSGLRQGWVRPALLVGCGIAAFTQLSGIEMIIYFAPTILAENGFSTTAALRVSVGLGVTYLVMMLMGWLTGSEIYPLAMRAAGTSVQSATLWGTNLLITLTLLTMITIFGVGQVFWIYALFNVAAWPFVWRRMPELTGHSLEDVERHLRKGTDLGTCLTRQPRLLFYAATETALTAVTVRDFGSQRWCCAAGRRPLRRHPLLMPR